ncbi:MAG: hypothetical protein ABGZ17_19435 [Planctomycetaceae bacterium]
MTRPALIQRRTFLRGSGVVLALPFLENHALRGAVPGIHAAENSVRGESPWILAGGGVRHRWAGQCLAQRSHLFAGNSVHEMVLP